MFEHLRSLHDASVSCINEYLSIDSGGNVSDLVLARNRPYSRRGHDGQKERLGLQIYRKFARQYVNCDVTSLLLHVPVT